MLPSLRASSLVSLSGALLALALAGCKATPGAARLGKPLADVTVDDLKRALESGGWKTGQTYNSSSGKFKNTGVLIEAGGTRGKVRVDCTDAAGAERRRKEAEPRFGTVHVEGACALSAELPDAASSGKLVRELAGK